MTFLVTVACAIGWAACPISGSITHELKAKDSHECHSLVAGLIAAYNYEPKHFQVKCEPVKQGQ